MEKVQYATVAQG